jgi:hypothetical protein
MLRIGYRAALAVWIRGVCVYRERAVEGEALKGSVLYLYFLALEKSQKAACFFTSKASKVSTCRANDTRVSWL